MNRRKVAGSRATIAILTLTLLGLPLAGCSEKQETEAVETDTTATWITGETRDPVPSTSAGQTVLVSINTNDLAVPDQVTPGPTVFTVTNSGNATHSLRIEGNGIQAELTDPVAPGGTEGLPVTLAQGKYQAWCPIENHRELGEWAEFTAAP